MIEDIYIRNYIDQVCLHQNKISYDYKIFRTSDHLYIFFKTYFYSKSNFLNFLKKKKFKKKKRYRLLSKKRNLRKKQTLCLNNVHYVNRKKLLYIKNLQNHLTKYITKFFKIKHVYIFNFKSKFYGKSLFRYKFFLKKNFSKFFFRKNFLSISNLIYISLGNKSANLLSKGLSILLKKEIKHNQFFRFLNKLLFLHFIKWKKKNKTKYLKGYRIEIKGKINGKPRKKKKIISNGRMPFSSTDENIKYSFSEVFTKYGVFGIKV